MAIEAAAGSGEKHRCLGCRSLSRAGFPAVVVTGEEGRTGRGATVRIGWIWRDLSLLPSARTCVATGQMLSGAIAGASRVVGMVMLWVLVILLALVWCWC